MVIFNAKKKKNTNLDDSDEIRSIIENKEKTQLTEFFKLNQIDQHANQFLYFDLPKAYIWENKRWKRRHKLISKKTLYNNHNFLL